MQKEKSNSIFVSGFWIILLLYLLQASAYTRAEQDKEPSLMEMNDPQYLLAHSGPWVQHKTDHFDFYFFQGIDSVQAKEVMTTQEVNYKRIVQLMGLKDQGNLTRIKFWLFKDKDEKIRKTKVSSDAHALPPYTSVYYLPTNATGGQEVGHILTVSQWGFISNKNGLSLLVDEGFNFYIDEEDYWIKKRASIPFDSLAVLALSSKEHCAMFKVSHLAYEGEDGDWGTEQAKVSGAFVKFLIHAYGVESFGNLWREAAVRKKTDIKVFSHVYSKPLDQLEQEFYDHLGLQDKLCTK